MTGRLEPSGPADGAGPIATPGGPAGLGGLPGRQGGGAAAGGPAGGRAGRVEAASPAATAPAGDRDRGLIELLYGLADDELVIGHRASEWTGVAPHIEEDVAFSSIAQDEVGHAALLYRLLADLGEGGGDPDRIAFGRPAGAFRNATLVEQPNGDWAVETARHFLYSEYEAVLWAMLQRSPYPPLAEAAARIAREEAYHQAHFRHHVLQLARAGGEARARLERALARCTPLAAGLFEAGPAEDRAAYWRGGSLAELAARWREGVAAWCQSLGLSLGLALDLSLGQTWAPGPAARPGHRPGGAMPPAPRAGETTAGGTAPPPEAPRAGGATEAPGAPGTHRDVQALGGRWGRHTPAMEELLREMTSVYRLDPAASW